MLEGSWNASSIDLPEGERGFQKEVISIRWNSAEKGKELQEEGRVGELNGHSVLNTTGPLESGGGI